MQNITVGELIQAIMTHNAVEVRRLIEGGADPNGADEKKRRPMVLSARLGSIEFSDLLTSAGGDIESYDGNCTPLLAAAMGGHLEMVKFLLSRGAKLNVKTSGGLSPVRAAMEGNFKDVVAYLQSLPKPSSKMRSKKVKPGIDQVYTTRQLLCIQTDADMAASRLEERLGLSCRRRLERSPSAGHPSSPVPRNAILVISFHGNDWTTIHAMSMELSDGLEELATELSMSKNGEADVATLFFAGGADAEALFVRVMRKGKVTASVEEVEGTLVPERTFGIDLKSNDVMRLAQRLVKEASAFVPGIPLGVPIPLTTLSDFADACGLEEATIRDCIFLSA